MGEVREKLSFVLQSGELGLADISVQIEQLPQLKDFLRLCQFANAPWLGSPFYLLDQLVSLTGHPPDKCSRQCRSPGSNTSRKLMGSA